VCVLHGMYYTLCYTVDVDWVTTQLYEELMASGLMWTIRYRLHAVVMRHVCCSSACMLHISVIVAVYSDEMHLSENWHYFNLGHINM